jgi:TldD protein
MKSHPFASTALGEAKKLGATYADIRLITTEHERVVVRNGNIGSLDSSVSRGFGVRVICDGAWGFAASPQMEEAEVRRVTALAVEIARASSRAKEKDVVLAPEPPAQSPDGRETGSPVCRR